MSWGRACDLRCLSDVSVNLSHHLVGFLGASFRCQRRHRTDMRDSIREVLDDAVTDAAAWAQECVLLGASYDTRAHRLPALARHVFEVDHPVTQAVIGRLGLAGDGPRGRTHRSGAEIKD